LLAAVSVAGIVYLIYRYQLNKKLEVERLRLRISRDLHDDIGSALTSINVLSKVALSKGGGNMEIGNYLSQIKNAASDTMESMSDIVWAINPENDKLEAIVSRMKEFAAEICEAKQVDLDFILPKEPEKISFDAAKRKNIFLIFKEAVNNAIKYSHCTRLYIGLEKESNKLKMEIKDNGKGFDINNTRPGNGLKSMKERAKVIDAVFTIQSMPGKGTAVLTEIPL
jgi:signal transduction histidine kinase